MGRSGRSCRRTFWANELGAVLALPKLRTRYGLTNDQAAELLGAYRRQAESISGTLALPDGWRSTGSDGPETSLRL